MTCFVTARSTVRNLPADLVGLLQEGLLADAEEDLLRDVLGILVLEALAAGELHHGLPVAADDEILHPLGVAMEAEDGRPHRGRHVHGDHPPVRSS